MPWKGPILFRNIGIFLILIKGYGIFKNFLDTVYWNIFCDIENINFEILDIAYPAPSPFHPPPPLPLPNSQTNLLSVCDSALLS